MVVVAVRLGASLGGIYALGIHDDRRRVGVLADPLPFGRPEDPEDALPKAAQTETSEMVVDGGPG